MSIAYIGLGSNMADKTANLKRALAEIGGIPGSRVLSVSSFYRTEPVGVADQDWFVNAAASIETFLQPEELMKRLLDIEKDMGRVRELRWGPRVIDLDILLFDDRMIDMDGLVVPHPLMHKRGFVLVPLAEIGREVRHPALKKSIGELLSKLHYTEKVEKMGGN